MATRTFLTQEQLDEAKKMLRPPLAIPGGKVLLDHNLTAAIDFSSWLSLCIENRLREIEGWEEASPIAIGSWGRGELCPGSDLDVIFCGDPEAIKKVVDVTSRSGMKFRYRVPDNLDDWTQNVEELEINALFNAKAFTKEAALKLQEQKVLILKNSKIFRKKLLKKIVSERKLRFKRYDSIANFLEPNLKFGTGGLRDLHQALIVRDWFPERFSETEYAFKVLDYYRCLFLMIRQKLHLQNSHDILTAHDQHDLSDWFGYRSHRDFMMEVQKGLSRVSFHSDWANERCTMTIKKMESFQKVDPSNWLESFKVLKKDQSLQTQAILRKKLYDTRGFKKEKFNKAGKGKILKKIFDIKADDELTVAAFRSQMVSHLVPNFTKVIGLVQHDQYHRYSVNAHLLQAVREVRRIYKHPKLLGKLEFFSEKLKVTDWNILRWTALYHDIAKGQPGDHSTKGREMVLKDLKAFGFSKDFVYEVAWLVENHLILSTASFRKNPHSPKTWEYLFSRGVRGARLYRLAIFTVIDILATNPEAWNSWKENLLCEMVDTLRNPSPAKHYDFTQNLKREQLKVPEVFLNELDPSLIEAFSQKVLIEDFRKILSKEDLSPLVMKDKRNRVWIRFHRKKDQAGLVLEFTRKLTSIGCNIRQAMIYTDPQMGVYDWFCVKTNKSVAVLKRQLQLNNLGQSKSFQASFSQIDLVSWDEEEWVFSFRAKDKKGLLLTAIQSLHEEGLQISWAKVHTWGRQIDDIFGVVPKEGQAPEDILKALQGNLVVPELQIL